MLKGARQLASVAQLVRALYQNHMAAGSIPARDLKLHFLLRFLVRSNINVYKFPLDNFHLQYPSNGNWDLPIFDLGKWDLGYWECQTQDGKPYHYKDSCTVVVHFRLWML